jgi:DNA invertase Pin-like site-specific DNA recombinase
MKGGLDMDDELKLIESINRLNKTMALLVVKGEEREQQVKILFRLGFSQGEIAEIIGINQSNVSRALSNKNKPKGNETITEESSSQIGSTETGSLSK